jgi:F-type H+-transporting ATPase subunit b
MSAEETKGGRSFPIGWIVLFILGVILAYLVDEGQTHLGVPDYIWLPVNLTLFLYVLSRLVGKPMMASLDARRDGIVEDLQKAREQLEEADRLQADAAKRLADVESEIGALREKAAADGEAEAARIAEQTREEEARFLRRVEDEISRRETETRARLAQDAADLTAQMARELLEREMTDEDRRRVLERSLDAMKTLEGKES